MSAFATAVEAALPETGAVPDSFFLGLSCILLLGYTVFRVFGALRLPGAVGVMLAGCLLSPFAGPAIHVVLPSIQEVAFILLLCRAGCETNMADLNTSAVLLATLPLLADLTGIGLWVHFAWGATVPQGLLAGVMLAPVGEGLVLPLMHELRGEDLGPLPRLIACVAPLEGTFALFLYAFLATLGSGSPSPMWFRFLSGLVVRLAASVALGAVVGWGVARFCALSDRPVLAGRRVFVGGGVEMLLVLLGASLFSYGLSGEFSDGEPLVPNVLDLLVPDEWSMSDPSCSVDAPRARHCGGMLLQELALLCTGFFGAHFSPALAREAEALWSGLWVFGALFLFAAIGVSIDDVPAKVRLLPQLLPALACGLACRFVACLCVCSATARSRQSAFPQGGAWPGLRHVALEAAFCFAAGLPRATIQGVLASRPYVEQLYPGVVVCGRELAARGGLLQSLAQATLALMAPFGQLVLMLTARPILHRLRYSRAVLATERQIESICDFEPPQMAILTFHQQSERGSRGIDVLGALHYRLSSVRANTILGPTVEEVSGKADSSAAASSSTLRASTVRSSTVGPPRVSQAPSREEGEAPSGKAGAVAPSEKPLQAQLGGGRLRQCLTGLDQVVALVRARNASSGTEMT